MRKRIGNGLFCLAVGIGIFVVLGLWGSHLSSQGIDEGWQYAVMIFAGLFGLGFCVGGIGYLITGRFDLGGKTYHCPYCGEEIWNPPPESESMQCPKCHRNVMGYEAKRTSSQQGA